MGNAIIQNPVDRENHIVHGVKVLGFTSANGRIYDFAAVKEAIAKYEKAPVNKDHNMEEPSFSDRLGWLENVTLEKDGLYADFHYNPHADGIESFLWFAEHNGLGDVGFSHLVSGKYSVDPDGTERITRIDKVKSVDLVANPATTKTIFESERSAMKEPKSIKEAMSSGEIDRLKNEFSKVSNQSIDDDQLSRLRELFSQLDQGSLIKIFKAKMGVNGIVSRLALNHIKGGLDSVRNSKESMEESEEIPKGYVKVIGQIVKIGSKKHQQLVDQKRHFDDLAKHETGTKREGYKSIGSTWTPEEWKKQVEKNIADTKKTFPNVKFFTKDGHPDWNAHGINPKTMQYYSKESEQEDKPMGKKIAKEAGNAANKVKKNAIDRSRGDKEIIAMLSHPDSKYSSLTQRDLKDFDNPKIKTSLGRRQNYDGSLIGARGQIEKAKAKAKEQEDDDVGEAGNAANKVKKNANDEKAGKDQIDKSKPQVVNWRKPGGLSAYATSLGRSVKNQEQEDDDVGEARAEPKPTLTNQSYWNKSYEALKSIGKQAREASARVLKMGDMKNAMRYDEQNADAATVLGYRERNPKDPIKPEQEDDDVGEAYKDQPSDPYDLGVFMKKQGVKKPDNPFGDGIGTGKTFNSDQFDRGFSGRPRAVFKTKPGDPGEQEGDDEMDKGKLMEEENPMQQEEAEQDPMMEEEEDVYAKIKEVCEGEGSDEEKSKQVLEMLGLSGGMSEAEDDEEMKEDDDEETKEQDSEVLENDDEEMKEDDDEDPRKESKSELKSLRKWKSEKLKQEKIVNLIKESNLEPTKVFVKQLSAIDSKLWGEAIRDRRKVALTRSAVKPISSGSQSRSESSYKQFLESVLGK